MFGPDRRCVVVVGAQWGDEGKGKLVDVISEQADYVVRYQGGANAGHTVKIGETQYILHQIPSGILHSDSICVIALTGTRSPHSTEVRGAPGGDRSGSRRFAARS